MTYPSTTQPYATIIFICGGMAVYILYEIVRLIRINNKWLMLAEVIDGLWAIFSGMFFILITHLLYGGKIKYYTIFSYIFGIVLARLTIRPPFRKLIGKIINLYKSKFIINTKDIKKEDSNMAEAKKQKVQKNKAKNKQNKQNKQNKPE